MIGLFVPFLPDDFYLDTNDRNNEDIFDSYIGAEILLPDQDGNKKMAKVIKKVKGNDGNTVGTRHNNPMLYTLRINLCEHGLSNYISG